MSSVSTVKNPPIHLLGKIRLHWTSGKLGHAFVNSGNPDETISYEPSHHDFHFLLSFFIPIIKK